MMRSRPSENIRPDNITDALNRLNLEADIQSDGILSDIVTVLNYLEGRPTASVCVCKCTQCGIP
jgi:hypothetical protein